MSLEQQKKGIRSERRMTSTAESRFIKYIQESIFSKAPSYKGMDIPAR
jgi:hypothetical protein